MSFLQPLLLAALPLVALPIIIHLINQRRYQTVKWGAMMFLLNANRLSRGYARLRQWLILLCRALVILGLIMAVARPLASGSLGAVAGGQADTTIILLDRSPSMQQQRAAVRKLDAGRQKLVSTLKTLGSDRWVLVESSGEEAREIESPDALLELPETGASDTPADIPTMLERARDYMTENGTGRTEVWICSDARSNDWDAESGRWQTLRDSFLEMPQGVRFHLLAYAEAATDNLSLRVTKVRRQESEDEAEVLISLRVERTGDPVPTRLPLVFEIEGARSELNVQMDGLTYELKDHRIPIERARKRGWGQVSIPADINPADNQFYFVFDEEVPRRTVVVSQDAESSLAFELAASIPPESSVTCEAFTIGTPELAALEWDSLGLLIWSAPLPRGDEANDVQRYVERGGQVIFVPPATPDRTEFMGTAWAEWTEEEDGIPIETWRGDQDLLANTQSGMALPVGQLRVRRYCGMEGDFTTLATLGEGTPLLARVPTDRGGVYFCATTSTVSDSSLATNGIVLYVLLQRALAVGADGLGQIRQLAAGEASESQAENWQRIEGPLEAISTEYAHRRGVYSAGDRLVAVNRDAAEDVGTPLAPERVSALFEGLPFSRVDDRAGSLAGLVQEIWRLFLVGMMLVAIAEAALCLPRRQTALRSATPAGSVSIPASDATRVEARDAVNQA